MRLNVIEQAKVEITSYLETTGEEPTLLILSKPNYEQLVKLSKSDFITKFVICGIKLKVITSEYYDDNTLYVSR